MYKKNKLSELILGYNRKELYNHITNHPNWDKCKNFNWHLDHIYPIRVFFEFNITNPKIINHLSNLQPLLAQENLIKNDSCNLEFFINWLKNFDESELQTKYETILNYYKQNKYKFLGKRNNCSSKYIGVNKYEDKKHYTAFLRFNNKTFYLGYFTSEEEAAKNYDFYHLKIKGAAVNFPDFDYSKFIPKKVIDIYKKIMPKLCLEDHPIQ